MSAEKDTGGSAFPYADDHWLQHGMTLRDYFAAKAMQAYYIQKENFFANEDPRQKDECAAVFAYQVADAMLEARKQ